MVALAGSHNQCPQGIGAPSAACAWALSCSLQCWTALVKFLRGCFQVVSTVSTQPLESGRSKWQTREQQDLLGLARACAKAPEGDQPWSGDGENGPKYRKSKTKPRAQSHLTENLVFSITDSLGSL